MHDRLQAPLLLVFVLDDMTNDAKDFILTQSIRTGKSVDHVLLEMIRLLSIQCGCDPDAQLIQPQCDHDSGTNLGGYPYSVSEPHEMVHPLRE